MGRPRLDHTLSPENVFSRMVPGRAYKSYKIADKMRVRNAAILPILKVLVAKGLIEERQTNTTPRYVRPDFTVKRPAVVTGPGAPSVASYRIPISPPRVITDYEREIQRRQELCMMVRR
ncbi:hypothetical protein [Pandoraea terrigena]|uniref:Uncharacterized protein n=1 Tax=Pandoraea terrigena TaxID=2508292 RepID=A0A5E4V868_9BURK|nr:hypothetical protein [Pandoraea terrigena]VVE07235.1 hypothetical protein PTE31013_02453 [Pandoraea terrigena]